MLQGRARDAERALRWQHSGEGVQAALQQPVRRAIRAGLLHVAVPVSRASKQVLSAGLLSRVGELSSASASKRLSGAGV